MNGDIAQGINLPKMCLILLAYQQHPEYPLIVIANRDEFYQRPTQAAHWWPDAPTIWAGRDTKGGGSWFGVNRAGRWAALTNFRNGFQEKPNAPTRGHLVTGFLQPDAPDGQTYLTALQPDADRYNGFNLLTYDGSTLLHYSNVSNVITTVQPGIHGLSNALLNSDWPKVHRGKAHLAKLIATDAALTTEDAWEALRDTTRPDDANLPSTGIPLEWERKLSAMYIETEGYGTRCSTVLRYDRHGHCHVTERSYVPEGLSQVAFRVQEGH